MLGTSSCQPGRQTHLHRGSSKRRAALVQGRHAGRAACMQGKQYMPPPPPPPQHRGSPGAPLDNACKSASHPLHST